MSFLYLFVASSRSVFFSSSVISLRLAFSFMSAFLDLCWRLIASLTSSGIDTTFEEPVASDINSYGILNPLSIKSLSSIFLNFVALRLTSFWTARLNASRCSNIRLTRISRAPVMATLNLRHQEFLRFSESYTPSS